MPDQPESVVVGIDWHAAGDRPIERVGPDGKPEHWAKLTEGAVRGGHAVCIPHDPAKDLPGAHRYFDQLANGTCVGFAWSRRQSLHNRRYYDGFKLYDIAVQIDGLAETRDRDDGTTVRAGGDVLVDHGAFRGRLNGESNDKPTLGDGIARFLHCRSIDQMLAALANPVYVQRGAAPYLQSWGPKSPRLVWVDLDDWNELLFGRNGDAAIGIDRPTGLRK